MSKPQTASAERRSCAMDIAFSIEMEYRKKKYQQGKTRLKHHVLSLAELKSRLMLDGLLGRTKEGMT